MRNWLRGNNAPIVLMCVAAFMATLLMAGGGWLLYHNTQGILNASQWVRHTDEVMLDISRSNLLTERIEASVSLHSLRQERADIESARSNASKLVGEAVHLGELTEDNPDQTANVLALQGSARALSAHLENHAIDLEALRSEATKAHRMLELMAEQERRLMNERQQRTWDKVQRQFITELTFVLVALFMIFALFGLMLRDVLRRRRMTMETTRMNGELRESLSIMHEQAFETNLLAAARQEFQLCLTAEQVYAAAALHLAQLVPGSAGTICRLNHSGNLLEVASTWPSPYSGQPVMDVFAPESCCGLRSGQLRWRKKGVSELHCDHFASGAPSTYLCLPMVAHGETLGMVSLECPSREVVEEVESRSEALKQLVQFTGMTLAAVHLRTELENQSVRDALTGLFNRRFMQVAFERELARAARRNHSIAVFMLDVDHFKRFNDVHGHAAGDAALRAVADVFRTRLRAEDIICRYGGEEFAIILPEITREVALQRAESIRRAVAGLKIDVGAKAPAEVTISVGMALYAEDGNTAEQLLAQADRALYLAKRNGRDRVVMAGTSPAELRLEATLSEPR